MRRFISGIIARAALLLLLAAALIGGAQAQIGPAPGGGGGGAGVSSLATTCPTTGAATGAVTLSGLLNADLQTVTSYNVPASDCGWAVIANNASPVGFSLVTANYASGYLFTFKNRGAGLLTITPTAGQIDGGASATLATGNSASVYFDGTNYWSFPGKGATPGGSSGQVQTNNGSGGFGGVAVLGSGSVVEASDLTGSGTKVATATAAGTSGNCVQWSSGNLGDAGAACGGGVIGPAFSTVAGYYYPVNPGYAITAAAQAPGTGLAVCSPFTVPHGIHIDSFIGRINLAGSTTWEAAIYLGGIDATSHKPQPQGTPLATSGAGVANGVGDMLWSASLALSPNTTYWLCTQQGDATVKTISISPIEGFAGGTGSTGAVQSPTTNWAWTLTYNAATPNWPTATGVAFTESNAARAPVWAYHVASDP